MVTDANTIKDGEVPTSREVSQMVLRYSEMLRGHAAYLSLLERRTREPHGLAIIEEEIERAQFVATYLFNRKGTL